MQSTIQELIFLNNQIESLLKQQAVLQKKLLNNEHKSEPEPTPKIDYNIMSLPKHDKNMMQTVVSRNNDTIRCSKPVYWNTYQDIDVFMATLNIVDKLIMEATKYGGKVFGGFVRNVLVPKHFNQPLCGYKDVDFWFKDEEMASLFVKNMVAIGTLCTKVQNHDDAMYKFKRTQYLLYNRMYSNGSIIVDVVISSTLPVDDFDVNQLTYDTKGFQSLSSKTTCELLNNINNKRATILPDYTWKSGILRNDHNQERRITKLISAGWKIQNREGEIITDL